MFRGMHRGVGVVLLAVVALVAASSAAALPGSATDHGAVVARDLWREVGAFLTQLWPGILVGDHEDGGAAAVAAGEEGSGSGDGSGPMTNPDG